MALGLPYKLQISFIIKLLPFTREYQHINIQSLIYQIILKPLLINFNYLLQYIKKSIQRIYKLSLQINNFIKETITITVIAVVTVVTDRDHIALYIIKKDIIYKNILRRSKKGLKLNLRLLIKTNLANLITNLRNNLINIL